MKPDKGYFPYCDYKRIEHLFLKSSKEEFLRSIESLIVESHKKIGVAPGNEDIISYYMLLPDDFVEIITTENDEFYNSPKCKINEFLGYNIFIDTGLPYTNLNNGVPNFLTIGFKDSTLRKVIDISKIDNNYYFVVNANGSIKDRRDALAAAFLFVYYSLLNRKHLREESCGKIINLSPVPSGLEQVLF